MQEKKKKIIALVGMAGSGKTEAVEYLQEKFHWPKVYFGDVVFDEMKKQGLEMNQENERETRERLRAEEGMGVCAKRSLDKIKKALEQSDIALVESLYSWEEYRIMKRAFGDAFQVVAVFASPALRFSRLRERPVRPLKTFEEFEKRDWTEIEKTDKGGPIAIADHTILNEESLKELHAQLEKILEAEGLLERIFEE